MEQLEPLTLIRFASEVVKEPSKILTFKPTAGFRPFKEFFVKEAVKHPAKANLHMIRWIIEKYTEKGDVILDPMAGTFTTCIMGSLLGRNSIGVEYEQKFVDMGKANVEQLNKTTNLESRGKIVVLKGDARSLSGVLLSNSEQIDVLLTSPPYARTRIDVTNRTEIQKNAIISFKNFGYFDFGGKRWSLDEWKKINKGRMDGRGVRHGNVKTYGKNPSNIANLHYSKIDTVITSPPYANRLSDVKINDGDKARMGYRQAGAKKQDNLGNLQYGNIDAIVTSPPYEGSMEDRGGTQHKFQKEKKIGVYYSHDRSGKQIGNLRNKTYLSAMLKVYAECYKVLKPNGLMILITKNFIRKKKVVRLDLDTIKLCRHAGFTFIHRWYRKLTNFSFWITIYYKKYGLRVEYEDILVFRKEQQ